MMKVLTLRREVNFVSSTKIGAAERAVVPGATCLGKMAGVAVWVH